MKNILNSIFNFGKKDEQEAQRLAEEQKLLNEQRLLAERQKEEQKKIAEKRRARKQKRKEKLKNKKEVKPSTPAERKEHATKLKQPWCEVIAFRTTPDNIRYGFFELDWNQYQIELLIREGFGSEGDPEEDIIGRWFKYINHLAAQEEEIDMTDRMVGHIDITRLKQINS